MKFSIFFAFALTAAVAMGALTLTENAEDAQTLISRIGEGVLNEKSNMKEVSKVGAALWDHC